MFQQIRDIDPQIYPQLQLQSITNFIDEIRQQTESGFGPDVIITDSETALALYRLGLVDPTQLSEQDRQDTPQSLLDLVTAKDGARWRAPSINSCSWLASTKSACPLPQGPSKT